MSAIIFVEGGARGAYSKELQVRCREGFRKLLENCGFTGRMPGLFACGGRQSVFDDFKMAHKVKQDEDFVAMLIDSEDPIADIEQTWDHLKKRKGDKMRKPAHASDDQVLMMTTCMETWIICDHEALSRHYGAKLQQSALPSLVKLEQRDRHGLQSALENATRKCSNAYAKGKRSFQILALLQPANLEPHLPSFVRMVRILKSKL